MRFWPWPSCSEMAVIDLTLARALRDYLARRSRVLLVEVDSRFGFLRSLGDRAHYGLPRLNAGDPMDPRWPFLHGLDPRQRLDLSFVEVRPGLIADVQVVPVEGSTWVVLFDVLPAYERERKLQQRSNETRLLNEKLTQIVGDLRRSQSELSAKTLALKQANESKARLIASFSHELRTPLTAILGYAEHLKPRSGGDAVLDRGITAIERSGEHLLTLIDNLLDASVLELGEIKLMLAPATVRPLLLDLCELCAPLAARRGLAIELEMGREIPPALVVDAGRLRQILLNLLSNAIKFTENGKINVRADYRHATLVIAVGDDGAGIPDALQSRLFEPFARGLTAVPGTGLGLSISRALAQAHGGTLVLLESARGALFELVIPALTAPAPAEVFNLPTRRAGRLIMVCDDDPDIQALIAAVLTDAGYPVASCDRGADLLARCAQTRPVAVLLDLRLGERSGFDCLKELRAAGSTLPVIAMSADNRAALAQEVIDAGFAEFVPKPIQLARLIATVDHWSLVL